MPNPYPLQAGVLQDSSGAPAAPQSYKYNRYPLPGNKRPQAACGGGRGMHLGCADFGMVERLKTQAGLWIPTTHPVIEMRKKY